MIKQRVGCILIICLIVLNTNAQNQQIWIGESLTEVIFENGKWLHQSEKRIKEIKKVDSSYFVVDEISQEPRYKIGFEKLKLELDTIKLNKGFKIQLFIKSNLLLDNNFKFHSFEFDILGISGTVKTKYHLNRFGIFRKSNHKNETLIEKTIPDESLKEFEALFQRIDIRYMDNAQGMRNNCDNLEYSFTFWDLDGKRYNYIAIAVRKQLLPIKHFIINLEK